MSATDDLLAIFQERDRVARDLAELDRRIKAALPAFGREQGYSFHPSVEAARRALGIEISPSGERRPA